MWDLSLEDRKALKNFNNVEFKPLLQTPITKLLANAFTSTKTLTLLPIPGLHVIHLGPVNFVWKELKKRFYMHHFEVNFGLTKSDKQKQQFQGPEIKILLKKLPQLREYLPENLHGFVDILESINEVYTISFQSVVNQNHKLITATFEQLWKHAMVKYGITMPLKVHIICHHLSDYFCLTGKTLRKVNDQVVESSHSKVRKFFDAHPNYNHKIKTSPASGEATLAGIIHFNTNSI